MGRNTLAVVAAPAAVAGVAVTAASGHAVLAGWLAFAGIVAGGACLFATSDAAVLRAMHAYPVGEIDHPVLHRLVREASARAQVPAPRVAISPTDAATAFATGRGRHTTVCVTEGLLDALGEAELRAVLAHELAHVRRGDSRRGSLAGIGTAVVIAGLALGLLCRPDVADPGWAPLAGLGLMLLAPVAGAVAERAAIRGHEYAADTEAARATGEPLALARALRTLDARSRRLGLPAEPAIVANAHLMIVGPRGPGRVIGVLAAHPPMAERVARLEQLAGYRR